jgi:hypothetical protein
VASNEESIFAARNGGHHKTFAADFYICRAYGKRVNK